jgi:cyclic beta-1,2-glucan synthetase
MNMFLARMNGKLAAPWDNENPITGEIFGPERFAEHARSLAKAQRVAAKDAPVYSVVKRLEDNANALQEVFRQLCASVGKGRSLTPAAEWLIDNFHLVEQHVRHTRLDLPAGFYRQLPKLAEGPLAGHPRIFGLLWAYVAHTDSNFDPGTLTHSVNAYQAVDPLTIGELWATPIALRLSLIENLRRISVRMNNARIWREKADEAADKALATGKAESVAQVLESALPAGENIAVPFAVQLLQRFRDLDDGRASSGLNWLDARVKEADHTLESIISHEHQRQGAANVMVRNIVSSLRLISDVNWETWFDGVSQVEALLQTNTVYADMDFRSRNMYRSAIEQLARGSSRSEIEVARLALEAARHAPDSSGEPGYCLIGSGRGEFESFLHFKLTPKMRVQRAIRRGGLFTYLAPAFLIAAALITFVMLGYMRGEPRWWVVAVLALTAFFPASEIGFAFVNQAITFLLEARVLPGLAFRNGVDDRHRTLIAVPALLTDWQAIDGLVERLEVHFLSNGGSNLYFALVTDWSDSDHEHRETDTPYLDHALTKIAELNARHETDRFILLHRRRLWNPAQGRWMGWERKRGKLHELNRLLRGDSTTSFIVIGGRVPDDVKFVITLDQDTRLPRDMAVRMVGKLAHPLNKAKFDQTSDRVVEGYAILQPRVTASLPTGGYGSYYQQLFSTARGIDPYVWAASDVYQDLFNEGSFAGKGIYDIDSFELALKDRVPENAMLSHDLFEGIFARSALLSDVEVIEDYPDRHDVSAARSHRWARGDWQLLPWIAGTRIPAVGLWKMLDNLRRTLVPIAQVLTFVLGWLFLGPREASLLSLGVMLSVLLPHLIPSIMEALRIVPELGVRRHLGKTLPLFRQALAISAANLLLLPAQAALMADAIARTLYRLLVSKQNLLEWTTAAQVQAGGLGTIAQSYIRMWAALLLGLATLAMALSGLEEWYWLLPLAGLWLTAPALTYWMSQPAEIEDELLNSEADRQMLRGIARRTWRYFETFANAENNHLPPDNFQEDPSPAVASRTSPTNIGLYMLSLAAARELGWLNTFDAVSKLEATMATLGKLEKFRGHLLNWYDTQSLQPLDPRYVSSVDSGNLAGHLVSLANYCETWVDEPPSAVRVCEGIEDALNLLVAGLPPGKGKRGAERQTSEVRKQVESVRNSLARVREQPDMMPVRLVELAVSAANLKSTCSGMTGADGGNPAHWAEIARFTVEVHFREATANSDQRQALADRLRRVAHDARELAYRMEFGFLFDPLRELLSIGYRVQEGMRDENCYDMLASEARLASFFAVAKGDLPTRHWFKLGRTVTSVRGGAALISWSGSMFEYLMPSLVMRAPSGGLLDQTTKLIVIAQQDYAAKLGVPWGISESAFSGRDTNFTYQYSNFGVPLLGLKRGLAEELVIAPYATGLAAMVAPRRAARNYVVLEGAGASGAYGYYEALDYTAARLRPGSKVSVVHAYFAHHQGMTIVALLNALKAGQARTMFHMEPSVRATELLLQERAPQDVVLSPASVQQATTAPQSARVASAPPRSVSPYRGASPATHLLSNGQMAAMMTAAGSGYLTWNDIAITRWRQDSTREGSGQFVYVREKGKPQYWSAGHLPTGVMPDTHRILFSEHKVEFMRRDGAWQTGMECLISAETNAEARRITIANEGFATREIEITTYAELVLAAAQSDSAHPAFSKLFVETEFVPELGALIATRRRRSESDPQIFVAQMLVVDAPHTPILEFETDRARFIGRCRDDGNPVAMDPGKPLERTVGAVLDPVFALRCKLRVQRSRQVKLTLWTMVAPTREAVLDLIDQHRHPSAFDRAQTLAWTQAQIQLRHIGMEMEDANNFQELASHVLYPSLNFRPPQSVLARSAGPQSALWAQGVSGDRPIVMLRIDSADDILRPGFAARA